MRCTTPAACSRASGSTTAGSSSSREHSGAPGQLGQGDGLRAALRRRARSISACRQVVAANGIGDGYVRPLAWRGAEMMGVSAQHCRIHVAIAAWTWPAYFTPEARLKGIRMTRARYARPAPNTAPTAEQGRRAVHDLHAVQARGRGQGLRRRADARLPRLPRRRHRRQPVPGDRRQAAHAAARLLPQRHHPPDRDRAGAAAAASR